MFFALDSKVKRLSLNVCMEWIIMYILSNNDEENTIPTDFATFPHE